MMTTVEEQFGKLNILVNNVGDFLELIKPFKNFTDDEIDALFNANLNSMFKVAKRYPSSRKRWRRWKHYQHFLHRGFSRYSNAVVYSAFKHGITGYPQPVT